jgi:hypothetical protein
MVHPNVPAILFTPICPHSLSFRSDFIQASHMCFQSSSTDCFADSNVPSSAFPMTSTWSELAHMTAGQWCFQTMLSLSSGYLQMLGALHGSASTASRGEPVSAVLPSALE